MIVSPKIARAGRFVAEAQRQLELAEKMTVEIAAGIDHAIAESLVLTIARAMEAIGKAARILDGDDSP